MENWRKENIATMIVTAAIVLGLYWMGSGMHCLWGFLMLANLNSLKAN